jgi:hypothetical protein
MEPIPDISYLPDNKVGVISEYEKQMPCFFNPTIADPGFAAEAVEFLYSSVLHRVKYPVKAMDYFTKDAFGVGITPGDVKIKALHVRINIKKAMHAQILSDLAFLCAVDNITNGSKVVVELKHKEIFDMDDIYVIFLAAETLIMHFQQKGKVDVMYNFWGVAHVSVALRIGWSKDLWRETFEEVLPVVSISYYVRQVLC